MQHISNRVGRRKLYISSLGTLHIANLSLRHTDEVPTTKSSFYAEHQTSRDINKTVLQGYILLAVQAHVPSLHPPPCVGTTEQTSICEPLRGSNLSFLYLGLYLITIGDGAARACLPALGGEQFDISDPVEQRQEASFFNWYTFAVSSGGFVGLVFIVWVENKRGWDLGFGVCALSVLLGMLVWIAGFPFYRNQLPGGSPITRILQVRYVVHYYSIFKFVPLLV
jgi:dipeptide/tripeptide permease